MKRGAGGQRPDESAGPSTRRPRRAAQPDPVVVELRALDAGGAQALLERMVEDWQLGEEARGATYDALVAHMFARFGLTYRDNMLDSLDADRGSFGLREVTAKIEETEKRVIGLYHRLHELGLLLESRGDGDGDAGGDAREDAEEDEDDERRKLNLRRIVRVLEMVFHAKKVVLCAFQAKLAQHQFHLNDGVLDLAPDLDFRLGAWCLRFKFTDGKTNPFQNLLLFVLDAAMEKGYRKFGDHLYEPVLVDGRNTHAWRMVCTIKAFVNEALCKETNWEQWCNATASGMKNLNSAVEYLTNCTDYQLPYLRRQRGVYSFRNGVYFAGERRFHRFDDGRPLSEDVIACKFFDMDFDPMEHLEDWRDVPTPHLQSIMDYQNFTPEVCDWMYVMLGRLLYPLNEHDGWQVIPFFKGAGGSGKCYSFGTPTLMADGTIKAVQDVAVGDEVMGDDGTPRRVLELARGEDELFDVVPTRRGGVYPGMRVTREHVLCLKNSNQGSTSKWKYGKRVHWFDGATRTMRAKKFTDDQKFEAFRAGIDREEVFEMTVGEYLELPEYVQKYLNCYRVATEFPAAPEPLFDPWTLGAWLGDGDSKYPIVTNGDRDVVDALEAAAAASGEPLVCRVTGSVDASGAVTSERCRFPRPGLLERALVAYGMLGNKHVPHALKTGSRETRAAVLAGLLDTDGWKNPGGYYEITQKSKALADDVVFLARSLGLGASIKEVRKAAVKRAREGEEADPDGKVRTWGTYWLVNVFGAGMEDLPLRCARKRFAAGELQHRKDALRWGFSVVPAGRGAYYGFQTDGNQRFLLGDFTVTHNSTIVLRVAKMFYDASDVGVLSNNVERKFGLSAFHEKYLFVAPEVKNDLAIEQAEFQSVVSGEDVQVNVKHKTAFSVLWRVAGVLAGNEVPGWVDNNGSMQRRIVLFEFLLAVVNGDMTLGDRLAEEMGAILLKCNLAYRDMASRYGHLNIWTVLPQYFKETREQLAQSVNSAEAFLASTEVRFGEGLYCPAEAFRAALKAFEISNNFKSKKFDKDFFRGPFSKYGLRIERQKKPYRGTNRNQDFVFGLDLNDAPDDGNDLS